MIAETELLSRSRLGHEAPSPSGSALARGIQILQAFTPRTPALSARDLMSATGLPKPTVFRLVATLSDAGLLRYDEMTGRFAPTPALARLASPLFARAHIRQLSFGPMQALAERLSALVTLSLGMGLELVFVDIAQAKDCMTVRPIPGSHISLSRTASGRAYLCALPRADLQRYVDQVEASDAKHGRWLVERLDEARRDLAERGFCVSHGDLQRQFESVAVSLRTADKPGEIYVFACTVPSFELRPKQLLEEVGPRLVSLARSIEGALGAAPAAAA